MFILVNFIPCSSFAQPIHLFERLPQILLTKSYKEVFNLSEDDLRFIDESIQNITQNKIDSKTKK